MVKGSDREKVGQTAANIEMLCCKKEIDVFQDGIYIVSKEYKEVVSMEYEDTTVAQLKELLREADLPVSGNKSVLIERFTQNDESLELMDDSVQEELMILMTHSMMKMISLMKMIGTKYALSSKPVLDEETKASLLLEQHK